MRIFWFLLVINLFGSHLEPAYAASPDPAHAQVDFPKPLEDYHDDQIPRLVQKLIYRASVDPFNLVGTIIFFCAILHTFLTAKFMHIAHACQHEFDALESQEKATDPSIARRRDVLQFRAQFFHFMGEVEAVFGIWLVPLFIAAVLMKGWPALVGYITSLNPAEPVFVVVIMAIASSRPILRLTENWLAKLAALGGSTPGAWWLSILTLGPLLGSLITEPAAMTICALVLRQKFYALKPSKALAYATLGLLFVNISVGGTLTHFAAPPVVMVATKWNWDLSFMLVNFGWKAALGIVVANTVYYLRFRKELSRLKPTRTEDKEKRRACPGPNHDRAHSFSYLDGLHGTLRRVRGPGFSVLPGLRGSNEPPPGSDSIARADAGRVLSRVTGHPWRMPKMVDRSGPERIDGMAVDDRRNYPDGIQ